MNENPGTYRKTGDTDRPRGGPCSDPSGVLGHLCKKEAMGTTPTQPGVLEHWLVNHHPVKSRDGTVLEINLEVQETTLTMKVDPPPIDYGLQ